MWMCSDLISRSFGQCQRSLGKKKFLQCRMIRWSYLTQRLLKTWRCLNPYSHPRSIGQCQDSERKDIKLLSRPCLCVAKHQAFKFDSKCALIICGVFLILFNVIWQCSGSRERKYFIRVKAVYLKYWNIVWAPRFSVVLWFGVKLLKVIQCQGHRNKNFVWYITL